MTIRVGIYLFLIFSFAAGCKRENIAKESVNSHREYTAKKSIDSIPMESVEAETNGKKGGDTHFSISSGELFLHYQYFDDEAVAKAKIDEGKAGVKQVIEQGDVIGNGGEVAGRFSFTENVSPYENVRFCLRWSLVKRYAEVCSALRKAIEEFRAVYEL